MSNVPLLEVDNLRVGFTAHTGETTEVVHGVSFKMGAEKIGIVGESGSGKSITARSILRVLPPGCSVASGRITFHQQNLLELPENALCGIRGRHISMIMQDPRYSLNPTMRVGQQIGEMLLRHADVAKAQVSEKVIAAVESVRMRDPKRVMRAYPHELSGGMGQRVMIAMMLIAGPSLLIADEPTSALDVSVQMQILNLLDDLVSTRNMGLIFISHDIQLVASFCDRVLVMYRGDIVESCRAADLHRSQHLYTRRLWAATPRLERRA